MPQIYAIGAGLKINQHYNKYKQFYYNQRLLLNYHMNLLQIKEEIRDFSSRIISTLKLYQCKQGALSNQVKLSTWIRQSILRLKQQQQNKKKKKSKTLLKTTLQLFKKKQQQQIDPLQIDLKILGQCIKKGVIPQSFSFQSENVPENIKKIINEIKGHRWHKFYGHVKGPFMNDYFILKKQDFHKIVQCVQVNKLKFLMIQQKIAHKYQRNLVQQIFGRVFREKGALSLVIKIQVISDPLENPYNIFCYIQNVRLQDEIKWKPLNSLSINKNNLQIKQGDKTIQISERNMLQIFLSQILVLPLQSLVSDFIIQIKENQAQLIKYNGQSQQQIIKQMSLKQHPSLRNPLMYFRDYIYNHPIPISKAQKLTIHKQLYSCFYKCLQIVVDLILTDFSTQIGEGLIAYSSVCFNLQVFSALWITFHKISLLSGWMKQVIKPLKNTITISQIITHFCPIFIQTSIYQTNSFQQYRQFFLNLQMQNYLATIVKKNSLQKYKDMYVTDTKSMMGRKLYSAADIYNQIFRPIFHEVNLLYSDPIEAAYIFNFCCKYYFQYKPIQQEIEEKWKNKQIWQKCVKAIQTNQLIFIDIGFDFMGYFSGFDTYSIDNRSFQRVKNTEQSNALLEGLQKFINYVKLKYESNSGYILSSLLQKAFKHKKFEICRVLLQKKVLIKDFKQIINSEHQDFINIETKQNILKAIQLQSPQMHRLYKWQQLMIVQMKQKTQNCIQINTLQFGKCYVPQLVLDDIIKNDRVVNNLSRKDYRFNSDKQIAIVKITQDKSFYIQSNQFPLMLYFYKIVFNQLETPHIMFNFDSFFYKDKLYFITQNLRNGINYSKGLMTYTEQQLMSMTDDKLVAQAIILSMILLTKQIKLQNLIISPFREQFGQIFIIDWHSFYQKNFICKFEGKTKLNTHNSLFLMQIMNKSVHPFIVRKYSNIDVMKICQNIFKNCKKLTKSMQKVHQKQKNKQFSQQLLAMIFQNGFISSLAQRMFKIKRAFNHLLVGQRRSLSYFQLLQILHSEVSYYYQQVYSTSIFLKDREIVLQDQNWKRSFLHSNIIEFYGDFKKIKEVQYNFPQHYYKFCFQGPTQSLADIVTNLKKFKAFSDQFPQNLQQYSNEHFQYIMRHIDLSRYDRVVRRNFLQTIRSKSVKYLDSTDKTVLPLSSITLKSVEQLKQAYLNDFSFERVHQLIIQSCKLNDFDIKKAPKTLGNVMYLQLKNIQGLKYIGESIISGYSFQIKHLKTLSIINCNQLISVDLKCDILECLQFRNNQQLETVYIYSLNLKNISIYNCPNISLQNLGVYIIKGINVLLSRSSCRGDINKIYSGSYTKYVRNILKFLLISFYQKQIRYRILLTLCKMKQVSQQLFTQAGLTSLKPISSIFSKFSVQTQNSLLSEILRVYFSNPYVDSLVIGDSIIQLHRNIQNMPIIRLFKVFSTAVSNIRYHKSFNSLRLQTPSVIFEYLQRVQFKTLIDLIKTDKSFTLQVDRINVLTQKKDNIQKYIDLIRYLSIQKLEIQKLCIFFQNSTLSVDFFLSIFQGALYLQQINQSERKMAISQHKKKLSKLISVKSFSQQKVKFIKISKIILKNCKILNNKRGNQNKQKKQEGVQQHETLIDTHKTEQFQQLKQDGGDIRMEKTLSYGDSDINYLELKSVKHIRIQKCQLQSFSLLRSLPNLIQVCFSDCTLKSQGYDTFFNILSLRQIQVLDLQYLFSNTLLSNKHFNQFCQILRKMRSLKVLRLNKNNFTFANLLKLNQIINDTSIQELQLNNLVLTQKTIQHKITYQDEKIELISELRQKKQQSIAIHLRSFFKQTKTLRSLSIELNSLKFIQQFIKSMSENESIIYLRINTRYQIPSSMLTPLKNNQTLRSISSNKQLPVWLLNHVKNNSVIEKKKSMQQLEANNDDSVLDILDNALVQNNRVNQFYRIGLSLDGGGMRGMILATQLQYLCYHVGYPLHKIFDCIGGTSIGGILALGSTGTFDGYHPIIESSQLPEIFTKYGDQIFKKSQFRQLRNLYETKYSPASYQQVLKNYFKDCRMSNCLQDTSAIVTAVNRLDNKDYVFRSMEALLDRQKDFYMRDVARATSAAPTYFPSAQIKNVNANLKLSLIDGGLGMNNPSKLVIDEVLKITANSGMSQNYFLLSLGTGKLPSRNIPKSAGLKDISPIIDCYAESTNYFLQKDLSINYKGHFYRISPSIQYSNSTNSQLDNTSEQTINQYRKAGLQSAKKYFNNTIIFGKYRNMNLIQWLRQNTARKYQF